MTRRSDRVASSLLAAGLLIITCLESATGQARPEADPVQVSVMPWRVNCTKAADGKSSDCQMSRSMVLADSKQLLSRFTVNLFASSPNLSFLLQLPHGIYLPEGVSLSIDDLEPRTEPVQTCDPAGCYVGLGADRAFLTALQRGSILKVSFQNIGRNTVVINFPLDEFTTAYANMITWTATEIGAKD